MDLAEIYFNNILIQERASKYFYKILSNLATFLKYVPNELIIDLLKIKKVPSKRFANLSVTRLGTSTI